MFDESTRVPLFIYHPKTPFAGQHYWSPVELLDIYPTLIDLLPLPYDHRTTCSGFEQFFGINKVCHVLQGKSLARVVLGDEQHKKMVQELPYHNQNKMRMIVKRSEKDAQANHGLNLYPIVKGKHRRLGGLEVNSTMLTTTYYGFTLEEMLTHDWASFGIERSQLGEYFQYPRTMYNPHAETSLDHDIIVFPDTETQTGIELEHEITDLVNSTSRHLISKSKKSPKDASLFTNNGKPVMPVLDMDFAISQSWRCAETRLVQKAEEWMLNGRKGPRPRSKWFDCDKTRNPDDELSIMGYSLRTNDFRYTGWFHYNRKMCLPILDAKPYDEEVRYSNPSDSLFVTNHQI
jgi:hypothetical protein